MVRQQFSIVLFPICTYIHNYSMYYTYCNYVLITYIIMYYMKHKLELSKLMAGCTHISVHSFARQLTHRCVLETSKTLTLVQVCVNQVSNYGRMEWCDWWHFCIIVIMI